ncbi:hypothetical protein ACN4EK_26930 [Pantanalinema rosaneae CENA516]|uniref:hypothetical protein n=1 Tax=Pantanalinema rosaneae TaxID=1620701 RepID=UPI003D6F210F
MKESLKRIEATLQRLEQPDLSSHPFLATSDLATPVLPEFLHPQTGLFSSPSFARSPEDLPSLPELPAFPAPVSASTTTALLADVAATQTALLPDFTATQTPQRSYASHPELPLNLLQQIEAQVKSWQTTLQQMLHQIQLLYREGPIVDGWLESYVPQAGNEPTEASTAGYRLCGLNEQGQLWFRHCPPEQVADVSLAIVRHHKLQQLLVQKQSLENQLHLLTEALAMIQASLAGK